MFLGLAPTEQYLLYLFTSYTWPQMNVWKVGCPITHTNNVHFAVLFIET